MSEAGETSGIEAENAAIAPRDYARTRRRESFGTALSPPGNDGQMPSQALVSGEWPQLGLVMASGVALVALVGQTWPPAVALALLLPAIAITFGARFVRRFDQGPETPTGLRMVILCAVVAMPLFLFGMGTAAWAASGAVTWQPVLAILITVGLLASVFESGRLIGILAANVSMWAGVTCVTSRTGGYVTVALGALIAFLAYLRQREIDARHREQVAADLRIQTRAQEILAEYEETGLGWFWETDRRGTITYLSHTTAAVLGRKAEDLLGKPFADLFNLLEQAGDGERTLAFHLSARSSFSDLAVRAATPNEERWWSIAGRPTYDTFNNFQGFRGSGADLTEKRRSEEQATRLAQFDSLTGLSNRLRMSQTLEKILNAPQLHHRACSVFLLDLDRFKQVNDTLGHPAGDALLKQVSQRLERVVGKAGRVGRLGGDEFQVILHGPSER